MKKSMKITAALCALLGTAVSNTLQVNAELVKKAWGQGSSNTFILGLNNAVGSAVNIYTLKVLRR